MGNVKQTAGVSRRDLLQLLAASLAVGPLNRIAAKASAAALVTFVDIAAAAGITFRHDNAATPEKYLIETMVGGCGWIDYDQDGLLDLYLVNGAATKLYTPPHPLRSALYRNNGDGTFTDVTEKAGVGAADLFGSGVAVGDYDNDGFPDLYVAGYDRSILYHNNGDGTFTDVTARAGVANQGRWGASAAWFDYDNDGRLDLVVANYVDWSPENNVWCGDHAPGRRGYCHPDVYHGQTPTLYHNNGDGTFTDVSRSSGVGAKPGNGLAVVTFDYDNDGWQDIFIANDAMANFLFHNNRDGTFSEVGYLAGVAVSNDGRPESGMGADAADTTGKGWLDLIVTHLDFEQARLYRNLGDASFEEALASSKSYISTALRFGRAAASAASLTILARSAPENPGVPRASTDKSTSSARGILRVCTRRISSRPRTSGRFTTTRRSKRPGRSNAGSSTSGRLVAAIRMTPSFDSKPSISTSS